MHSSICGLPGAQRPARQPFCRQRMQPHAAYSQQHNPTAASTAAHQARRYSAPLSSVHSLQSRRGVAHSHSGGAAAPRQRGGMIATCSTAAASAGSVPLPSDSQDKRTIPNTGGNKTVASVRGLFFYLWTLALSLPLFVAMLVAAPFVLLFDKIRRLWQHKVNNLWAIASTTPWYRVQMEGLENLPAEDEPAVYVANHQSFLDIFSLFHLRRPFKFVSKTSNFYIPIVGWSMFLTGHVMINRVDNRSMIRCLLHCGDLLKQGASVLFFPEGTRSKDGKMAAFKKGAFSVAAKAGVPVVPITLIGTGALMPNGQEGRLYGGDGVRIIVHPRVSGSDAQKISDEVRRKISSRLPPELVA